MPGHFFKASSLPPILEPPQFLKDKSSTSVPHLGTPVPGACFPCVFPGHGPLEIFHFLDPVKARAMSLHSTQRPRPSPFPAMDRLPSFLYALAASASKTCRNQVERWLDKCDAARIGGRMFMVKSRWWVMGIHCKILSICPYVWNFS